MLTAQGFIVWMLSGWKEMHYIFYYLYASVFEFLYRLRLQTAQVIFEKCFWKSICKEKPELQPPLNFCASALKTSFPCVMLMQFIIQYWLSLLCTGYQVISPRCQGITATVRTWTIWTIKIYASIQLLHIILPVLKDAYDSTIVVEWRNRLHANVLKGDVRRVPFGMVKFYGHVHKIVLNMQDLEQSTNNMYVRVNYWELRLLHSQIQPDGCIWLKPEVRGTI